MSNGSSRSATVYLFRSASGATSLTLRGVEPHGIRAIGIRLSPGVAYSWGCDLSGYPDHVSDSERAPRVGVAGPVVVPVYVATLAPALNAYRRYAGQLLSALGPELAALNTAARSGDRGRARTAWLAAHLTWLRIGQDDAAYGAFGQLGQQIDGTAAGLVGGARSRAFTGFHKVEDDLWRRRDLAAAAADSARLRRLVAKLERQSLNAELPATKAGMTSFTIRCHEVLEDALRDSLSGDDDYGSHTDLRSLTADVAATRELLKLLTPDLDPRAPALAATAQAQLRAISAAIGAARRAGGARAPRALRVLPTRERQRLDQTVGAALQTLSRVPDLLGIGGT
ncbi:MAG TPA: EfeM/EfeO family lipoprotein [Solirubrobacteraceae bacterium]|nr:EfeM/EfeO family lipoprotein [Solirubrobacteraceae bacterium]